MATLNVHEGDIQISPHQLGSGSLAFQKSDTKLMALCNTYQLSVLLMTYAFPLRIVAGIIWGQGKSAAEADCQRRVQLRYMESKCPDIRMEDIDLPLNGNVVINAQRRLKEAGRWPAK